VKAGRGRYATPVAMARTMVLNALLLACAFSCALAQFNPSKPPAKPVKSDIKYIKCQVCELVAKNAYRQVQDLKKTVKPNKKVCRQHSCTKAPVIVPCCYRCKKADCFTLL